MPDLPKTRTGKIMRRLLRDVAEGRDLGDTTTLADPAVVEEIRTPAPTARRRRRTDAVATLGPLRQLALARPARSSPAPAVVFDMDGVLSDAAGRQHFLE